VIIFAEIHIIPHILIPKAIFLTWVDIGNFLEKINLKVIPLLPPISDLLITGKIVKKFYDTNLTEKWTL